MIVRGELRVPGDKSISHRALLFAALGDGRSRVSHVLQSADIASTADVLRRLGVALPPLSTCMSVDGVGLRGWRSPAQELDCGNSGTTARLVAGVVAAQPAHSHFVGDASLSRRPMQRIARPLQAMGARVHLPAHGGLPMDIDGAALQALHWTSDTASAQVKSAVLLAGLVAGVPVSVSEPARSRDHTERMLGARGVPVTRDATTVSLAPVHGIAALDQEVPGDPSSAAFFAALAALADGGELRLPDVCLNPTRTGFLAVLARMGADVEVQSEERGGEVVGSVRVRPRGLVATAIDGPEVPSLIDELPLVACLASRAEGTTVIRGAGELRVKESDRIAATVANLRALGVDAEELPDGLTVTGSRRPARGRVVTHGDHRLAMAFGVLGAVAGNEVVVDDPACASVSYPGFWRDLASVVG